MVGSICGIQESLYGADNGADSCATDKEGHTAAGLGKKYGYGNIAEYLSSRFGCEE